MASFTTRVELHNATREDYSLLHERMRAQGFFLAIRSDEGTIYHLPPAEYDYSGNVTGAQVLEKAKAAASSVKSSYAVLVTESAGRTWYGLAKVSAFT